MSPSIGCMVLAGLLSVLLLLISAVSIVANALVLKLILQQRSMQSVINLLLASIASADFLLASVSLPVDLTLSWLDIIDPSCDISIVYRFSRALRDSLIAYRTTVLVVLTIDRYFVIAYKQSKLDGESAKYYVISFVIWSLIGGALPEMTNENLAGGVAKLMAVWLLPSLVMTVYFAMILRAVRHNSIRIDCLFECPRHLQMNLRFKTKASVTLFSFFLTFLVFQTPVFLLRIFLDSVPKWAELLAVSWSYAALVTHVVICYARVKRLREEYGKYLRKCHPVERKRRIEFIYRPRD